MTLRFVIFLLLIRDFLRRSQAENPLIPLSEFARPALVGQVGSIFAGILRARSSNSGILQQTCRELVLCHESG